VNVTHDLQIENGPSPEEALVVAEGRCIVALVRERLSELINGPHTLCPPCRSTLRDLRDIHTRLVEGQGEPEGLDHLAAMCTDFQPRCNCELSRRAVDFVLSGLRTFRPEYEMHAVNKNCPERECLKLLPAPCHLACPAGIDIPSYLALLAHGRYEEALEVIRQDNPFAWVCGLICPHPCEKACVRAHLDEPINIRYLKAFVAEWTTRHKAYPTPAPAPSKGRKVAVIGSGPAGLAAAHYLALDGYAVTIFEALPVAGGLLAVGIPEYRLPREIVQKEIDAILSMGVEVRTSVRVGSDVTLDQLRKEGYEAFFFGIGAHRGYQLKIEGEDHFPQVYDAISFLKQVSLGNREKPAEKVVVVGGGNSAMDAARTCIRLGCKEVHVAYRRSCEQMPANPREVEEAAEEGVQFHFLAVAIAVRGENGRVTHMECLKAELGKPDASGRRRPIPVEGSNFLIETGAIIAAIGQQPDFDAFSGKVPVEVTPRNLILTRPFTTQTSEKDIFAGGDAVTGPATVVEAIAAGKQAAMDIDRYLSRSSEPALPFRVHKRRKVPFAAVDAAEKISSRRVPMDLLEVEERKTNFDLVEVGYSEELAQKEARRCLRCDVCIRCGACERVCRDGMKVEALKFSPISTTERILTDYAHAKEACIACGACAIACPTGAIDFIETPEKREVRLCGTLLNQLELTKCHACGEPFVPPRYLEYVTQRSDGVMGKRVLRRLCPKCARASRAAQFVRP
jgi:putative selenate reductase YgfK subunit